MLTYWLVSADLFFTGRMDPPTALFAVIYNAFLLFGIFFILPHFIRYDYRARRIVLGGNYAN